MTDETRPIRAFISIALEPAGVKALQEFQKHLDEQLPKQSVRWTPPEQMHLTLKFLGNVDPAHLEALQAFLQPLGREYPPLRLRLEGLGSFPSRHSPRVIWVGIKGDLERLEQLQSRINELSHPYAEKDEKRPFHPHLTLGRVRETAAQKARKIGQVLESQAVGCFGEWVAAEFSLMRSQLSPKGATHTRLGAFPFVAGS